MPPILTRQQLEDASADASSLAKFLNDAADVANPGHSAGTLTTRTGATYDNVAKIVDNLETLAAAADAAAAAATAEAVANASAIFASLIDARAATIPNGVKFVRTLGYRLSGDLGGADYILSVGASAIPLGGFRSADGAYWALLTKTADLRMFGAYGDGTLHTISAGDITANPQWMGPHSDTGATMYAAGYDSWDSVAAQEMVYWALAGDSTPGVSRAFAWNVSNKRMHVPRGTYIINRRILFSGYFFAIDFEHRGNTTWQWRGTVTVVGDTDGSTPIITNVTSPMGQIEIGQYMQGRGIAAGSKIAAFNTTSRTITLSKNTTSANSAKQMIAFTSMMLWNGVSYFEAYNVGLSCAQGYAIPRANPNDTGTCADDYLPSFTSLWTIDGDANRPITTFPHDAEIDICFVNGGGMVDVGVSISPSGNGAQGDNINFNNPYMSGFTRSAIQLGGNNVFAIGMFKGDFQGCHRGTLTSFGGTFDVYATQFENFTYTGSGPPFRDHVLMFGADIEIQGGGGASDITGVRSEGSVLCRNVGGDFAVVRNSNAQSAGFAYPAWAATMGFLPGMLWKSTVNNGSKRPFVLVDSGYQNDWHTMSAGAGPTDTITDPLASYTTNALVGKTLFVLEAQGNAVHAVITANTGTTITAAGIQVTPAVHSIYMVTGKSGASEPDWESAITGGSFESYIDGSNNGVTISAGSTTAYCGPDKVPAVNDYIMVPAADLIGVDVSVSTAVRQQVNAFFAKVTAVADGGPQGKILTLSRAPARTGSKLPFYWGAGLADGDLIWMEVDYSAVYGVKEVNNCQFDTGRVGLVMRLINVAFTQLNWFRGDVVGDGTSYAVGQRDTLDGGRKVSAPSIPLELDAVSDVSAAMKVSNYSTLTPARDMTLNAANNLPLANVMQEWTLLITTSGVVSYTLTFGTNFEATGTLATGATSGKHLTIKFVSLGGKWVEVSRSAP